MPHSPEFRRGPDRRRQPRGGRREEDRDGFSPLVMLVGNEPDVIDRSEAILAKLKFAVARTGDVDHALRALPDLRPDLVVAKEGDAPRLRSEVPENLPIIIMRNGPEAMMEDILRTLRKPATVTPLAGR